MKKAFSLFLIILLVGCGNIKEDYDGVEGKVNIKQINEREVLKVLDNGTAVLVFSFPDCLWCQELMPVLNNITSEADFDIFYFNVENIRKNKTKNYLLMYEEIVKYLEKIEYDTLIYDRIWVPTMLAIDDGEIVDFHLGTTDDHLKINGNLPPLTEIQEEKLKDFIYRLLQKVS
ncbi:hypothetical protein RI065_05370 [Mycoplasmatota bacterium zrk1]